MVAPRPRKYFGDAKVDDKLTQLMQELGTGSNDDLIRSLMVTALDMDQASVDRLDLKIASQAMAEILNAWRVFSPYNNRPKVTVFGSARTSPEQPDYQLAVDFGDKMQQRDWMSITGAGPGIMTAGIEGAKIENSFGVNIILPFEQNAAAIINDDDKLATFRYFFTRKLFFMKESDAFALFPGGYGTLDEAFELLTLIQTGKSLPAPIVLLDHTDSTYWSSWSKFVENELLAGKLISDADIDMYLHTHDTAEAADYICSFYNCYHSLRAVGNRWIIRLRSELSDESLQTLNTEFQDIVKSGEIEKASATKAEVRDNDHVELPRLQLNFDSKSFARLMVMIRRINQLSDSKETVPSDLVHDILPDSDEVEISNGEQP